MIGIIYIGQKRFIDISSNNHKKLIDKLKEKYRVRTYWYTSDIIDRSQCPWKDMREGASGALQVWDFVDSVQKVDEEIVVKLRTDVYFAESAIDMFLKEMDLIVSNQQDMSFIGMEVQFGYKETYEKFKLSEFGATHIQDFAIIARKSAMNNPELVYSKIHERPPNKIITGNKIFRDIISDMSRAYTIRSQTYLIRKQPIKMTDINIAYDFLSDYGKKSKEAADYFKTQL